VRGCRAGPSYQDAMAGDKRSGEGGRGTYRSREEGEGGQSWEGSDNDDGIGRTTGALRGEIDREREKKLKGDRERVQGGAFVSRCDGDRKSVV
jgi:hypothetical protein